MKVEKRTAQAIASIAVLSLLMCGGVFAYSTRTAQALGLRAPLDASSTTVTEHEKVDVSDTQTHTNEGQQETHELSLPLVAVGTAEGMGRVEIHADGTDLRIDIQVEQTNPSTTYDVRLIAVTSAPPTSPTNACGSFFNLGTFTTSDSGEAEVKMHFTQLSANTWNIGVVLCIGSTASLASSPLTGSMTLLQRTTHTESEETKEATEHQDDDATEKEINDAENSNTDHSIPAEVDVSGSGETITQHDPAFSVSVSRPSDNSLDVSISGVNGTGPRVLLVNLGKDAGALSSLSTLSVKFDGTPVAEASSVSQVFQGTATDSPSFVVILTASGTKLLIFVPHFSVHEIELTVPAAAFGSIIAQAPLLLAGIAAVAAISAVVYVRRKRFTAAPSL